MKIKTTIRSLNAALKKAVVKKLNNEEVPKINKAIEALYADLYNLLQELILASPEFNSLMNGKLRADFGLSDDVLYKMASNIVYIVNVYYEIINDPKKGPIIRFEIGARPKDDPYLTDAIEQLSYISAKSGLRINWLEWLLFSGTSTINEVYSVQYLTGVGRSGMAIMRVLKNGVEFSVDPEFAGVEGDNMVSRMILRNRDKIAEVFSRYGNVTQ